MPKQTYKDNGYYVWLETVQTLDIRTIDMASVLFESNSVVKKISFLQVNMRGWCMDSVWSSEINKKK